MSRAGVLAGESPGLSARRRIVAGARRHFFAHGLRRFTMDDLADELGMSKKTLYAHFPGKAALVGAAILDKFRELEAELGRATAEEHSDFPGALRRLLACVQRHTEEIQPPFLRDIRREAPALFKLVEGRRAALVQRYFGPLFAAGLRAGMVRKVAPARANLEDAKKGKRPPEIESVEAQLKQAQAALVRSEEEFARVDKLARSGSVSAEDLDRARANRDQDRQRVAQLEADLKTARL